jgi:hypothetical protein
MNFLRRPTIIAATILAMIPIISIFIIIPSIKDLQATSDAIFEQRYTIEKQYQQSRKIKTILRDVETLRQFQDQLATFPLTPGQELGLVTTIEALGQKNYISPTITFSAATGKKNLGYEILPVHISASGTMSNCLAFIHELPATVPSIDITLISFQSDSATGLIQMAIQTNVYRLLEPNAPTL